MNKRVEAIIEEARKLAPDEQDEVLRRLMRAREADAPADGAPPADGTPQEIEAEWSAEIERRVAATERGEYELIDADDVIAAARARITRS